MSILIKNGQVLHEGKLTKADVLVEDGVIKSIGTAAKADRTIDAKGCYVLPAFIDMHVHLREPGFEYKEDIESGCRAAARGGFATVCCMPNTKPAADNAAIIKYIKDRGREVDLCRVFPIGAITKGSKGEELAEMLSMSDAGAVAFSDDGLPVENLGVFKTACEYASTRDLLLFPHSEIKSLSAGGVVNEGESADRAGLKGIPSIAEAIGIASEAYVARYTGARLHFAHVSTKEGVEAVRHAKAIGARVTAETCPHYFALNDTEILGYDTNAKMNPPLRSEADRLAVIEGLKDGTIDVIATDHAPHSADEKNREFDYAAFGTTGLETAFAAGYTYLVKSGELTLCQLSRLMSKNPASILRTDGGELVVGGVADIVVVSDRAQVVNSGEHVSKGKNNVFNNKTLCGEIEYTFRGGKIIYSKEN